MLGATKNAANSKLTLGLIVLLLGACGGGGGGGSSSGPNDDPDGDGFNNAVDIDDDNDGLIEIATLEELDWMRNNLFGEYLEDHEGNRMMDGCLDIVCIGYELVADLDFDTNGDGLMDENDTYFDYHDDDSNRGWLPVGDDVSPFETNFEGNDYRISNLFIDRSAEDYIGLFGFVYGGPASLIEIRNVTLDGELMVAGDASVGGLVGFALSNVTIIDSSTSGSVTGSGSYTGGLVGTADSNVTITDSSAGGSVEGVGETGGLVGRANIDVTITDSSASGSVTGASSTGGLIGSAVTSITVTDSTSSGSVTGSGSNTGGLIGFANDVVSITAGSASGSVVGNSNNAGGLVGYARNITRITDSDASGNVAGGGNNTGGLVGYADGDVAITDSIASGNVTGGTSYTGGLVGSTEFFVRIMSSSASGDVAGSDYTGGLVGLALLDVTFENSFATGAVSGTTRTGGLIGSVNYDGTPYPSEFDVVTVSRSFATGAVTANNQSFVGGLIGLSYNLALEDCFATGGVSDANQYVGGLVGDTNDNTLVSRCFSANPVDGTSDVGAFVGYTDNTDYLDNYFADDINLLDGVGIVIGADNTGETTEVTGDTLSALQSVTAPGQNGLFTDWDEAVWDFGSDTQLPGLIIDGTVYRDDRFSTSPDGVYAGTFETNIRVVDLNSPTPPIGDDCVGDIDIVVDSNASDVLTGSGSCNTTANSATYTLLGSFFNPIAFNGTITIEFSSVTHVLSFSGTRIDNTLNATFFGSTPQVGNIVIDWDGSFTAMRN